MNTEKKVPMTQKGQCPECKVTIRYVFPGPEVILCKSCCNTLKANKEGLLQKLEEDEINVLFERDVGLRFKVHTARARILSDLFSRGTEWDKDSDQNTV